MMLVRFGNDANYTHAEMTAGLGGLFIMVLGQCLNTSDTSCLVNLQLTTQICRSNHYGFCKPQLVIFTN